MSKVPRILLAFLSVLTFLPFAPFFLQKERVLLYRDLSDSTIPAKAFWLQGWLTEGRIPRWNHFQSGGASFYADLVAAPLYPLNFVFLLFGPDMVPDAVTVYILLHYPFLFLGFAFLLRELKLPWRVSLPVALGFAWCGYALSAFNMTHILSGLLSLPWFFLFWLRALRTRTLLDALSASFFLALPIYGGDPQFTYMMALFSALHVVIRRFEGLKVYLRLAMFSLLCAAAQLVPTLELLRHSQRVNLNTESWGSIWAIQPLRLLDFLFPNFFGSVTGTLDYWGQTLPGQAEYTFFIHALYVGFAPLYLLVWALFSGWLLRRWKRKPKLLWVPFALLALVFFAMGPAAPLPLYEGAAKLLPLWSSFRYPERLAIYAVFFFLLISSFALRAHFLALRIARPRSWWISLVGTAFFCSALAATFYFLFRDRPTEGRPQIHIFLLTAFASLLFVLAPKLRLRSSWVLSFWLALILADFLPFFPRNVWFQPESITELDTYPATRKIVADLEKNEAEIRAGLPYRLLSLDSYAMPWQENIGRHAEWDPISYSMLAHWEGLAANIPSYFGIPSVQGMFSLELAAPLKLVHSLRKDHTSELLNVFGVRYLLQRFSDRPPEVKVNLDALPNFYFAREVFPVANLDEVIEKFDALSGKKEAVFLEGGNGSIPNDEVPRAELKRRDSARVEFLVRGGTKPAVFVWNESFYPSWRAYFDGQELAIQKANGWAMAVVLPERSVGEHRLEFRFDEKWIRIGQVLTLVWIAIFAFACFRVKAHGPGREPHAP